MERRERVYRICKKCMRTWNVSKIDPPGKAEYTCPECDSQAKEKEARAVA